MTEELKYESSAPLFNSVRCQTGGLHTKMKVYCNFRKSVSIRKAPKQKINYRCARKRGRHKRSRVYYKKSLKLFYPMTKKTNRSTQKRKNRMCKQKRRPNQSMSKRHQCGNKSKSLLKYVLKKEALKSFKKKVAAPDQTTYNDIGFAKKRKTKYKLTKQDKVKHLNGGEQRDNFLFKEDQECGEDKKSRDISLQGNVEMLNKVEEFGL